jgi:dipeptide transport system permease protein
MKMWVYIVRRLLLLIPVILGVMTITFLLVSQLPIYDRLVAAFGQSKFGWSSEIPCHELNPHLPAGKFCPNPAYVNAVHRLGLDQPLPVQWAVYMYHSLTLDWGTTDIASTASLSLGLGGGTPVATVLSWYLPYTIELSLLSLLLIVVLSVPVGNYAAANRNRPFDQGMRVMSFSGYALPFFIIAYLLLIGASFASGGFHPICSGTATPFQLWYGSWPSGACWPTPGNVEPNWIGMHFETYPTHFPTLDALLHGDFWLAWDTVRRQLLPAAAIAYGSVAGILRFVRNSMLEVMNLDYVRTARAKGVSERDVVGRHAGRNSLNVTVTVLGLTFAFFIGGFPIIEYVFHLQGIGLVLAYSIQPTYDYGLIFGTTLLFTFIVVLANLIVDVLYAYLDPRVRLG